MARRRYRSLREYLKETDTTQEAFAERFGLSQSQVSKILNGKRRIELGLALQIAEEAGIPVSSLLEKAS